MFIRQNRYYTHGADRFKPLKTQIKCNTNRNITPSTRLYHTQGQHKPPQVISTGRCQRIWPTHAVIGWLTKTRAGALLWLV